MGLGGSIFFLVLGAILAFAIKESPSWIDLYTVGWIFMIAGVVGIVLTSWYSKHQKRVHKEVHDRYQANRIARRQAIKRNDARRASESEQAEHGSSENLADPAITRTFGGFTGNLPTRDSYAFGPSDTLLDTPWWWLPALLPWSRSPRLRFFSVLNPSPPAPAVPPCRRGGPKFPGRGCRRGIVRASRF